MDSLLNSLLVTATKSLLDLLLIGSWINKKRIRFIKPPLSLGLGIARSNQRIHESCLVINSLVITRKTRALILLNSKPRLSLTSLWLILLSNSNMSYSTKPWGILILKSASVAGLKARLLLISKLNTTICDCSILGLISSSKKPIVLSYIRLLIALNLTKIRLLVEACLIIRVSWIELITGIALTTLLLNFINLLIVIKIWTKKPCWILLRGLLLILTPLRVRLLIYRD